MIKNNIIIGFSSNKICNNIINILNKNGINYDCVCKTGASLRKNCSYYENGIILCYTSFIDETTYNIVQDFYKDFVFLIIGNINDLSLYDNDMIYKIITPVKQEDILNAIDLAYYKNTENIKEKNNEIINKAKKVLMLNDSFTENMAHKYIQKKSMETGKKNIDIAKLILKKYKN